MAKKTCIEQFSIDEIKSKIDSGDFDVNKVREFPTWKQRETYLNSLFDKDLSEFLNRKFESTLLAKDTEKAFDKFADTVTFKNEAERAAFKAKLKENMNAKLARKQQLQEEGLIKDAETLNDEMIADTAIQKAKSRFKMELNEQEINDLVELDKKKIEFETKYGTIDNMTPETRDAYGQSINDITDYFGAVMDPEKKLGFKDTLKLRAKENKAYIKAGEGLGNKALRTAEVGFKSATSDVMKAMKASFDFIPIGRQIQKIAAFNPKIAGEAIKKGFEVMFGSSKKELYQKFRNYVASDEWYNKIGLQSKLHLEIEEYFKDPLISKLAGFGNVFKRSNDAFSIAMQGSRLKIFKQLSGEYLKLNKLDGLSLDELAQLISKDEKVAQAFKDIAYVSNSITGRGGLGKQLNKVGGTINKLMFAPRYVVSSLDTYIKPFDPTLTKVARQAYQKTSAVQLGLWSSIIGSAYIANPDSVDLRPNSSRFGYVKVGDKWQDITGGQLSYARLTAQLLSKHYISAGKSKEFLPQGYTQSKWDALLNFGANKLAPIPSLGVDILKQQRRDYGELDKAYQKIIYAAKQTLLPISIGQITDTALEQWDEKDGAEYTATMLQELIELIAIGGYYENR